MKGFIIVTLLMSMAMPVKAETLLPFETDYCTNYVEGTPEKPDQWKHCCLMHDMYFWAGGIRSDRDKADLDLKVCIENTGAPLQAKIIYYAVRAGSYSPIKYPKRQWNNGWNDGRKERVLSGEDVDLVEQEIFRGYDFIPSDIKDHFVKTLRSRM